MTNIKKKIIEHKEKHVLFAGKGGYFIMGLIAGWSAAHYFVCYAGGGVWPHDISVFDAAIEIINKLGGLTAVVGAGIALYTVYWKKQKGQADD